MIDPLADVRRARAALDAAEADLRWAVTKAHAERVTTGISVDAIATTAGLKSRQTVYTWAKEATAQHLETIVAPSITPGRLVDIARQTWPQRETLTLCGGNSFTSSHEDVQVMIRELEARGIDWGWQ